MAAIVLRSPNIYWGSVDAESEYIKRYDIQGYPTLKWFPKGELKKPLEYTGSRELDSLVNYVETQTGA